MNQTDLAYLTISQLRKMPTAEIRQVQLEINSLLETPTADAEEYRRLLGKCARVLGERHKRDDTPKMLLLTD